MPAGTQPAMQQWRGAAFGSPEIHVISRPDLQDANPNVLYEEA